MRFAFLARIREGLIPDRPGHQVVPDSVTGTYAGWDDDRATYTLQWGPAAGGLFYGWSMADEADTAIEALEAIRADDERLTDPAFLGVAIEHTHQLRERLDAIEEELARYVGTLGDLRDRPRLVALNKVDVPEAADLAALVRPELERRGLRVFEVSAVSHAGLRELGFALAAEVEADRAARPVPDERIVLRPPAVDDTGFTVAPDPQEAGGFVVRGVKPERWVRQTDFSNDEAVGYLADRLARLGVEDELSRLGAEPGAAVTIGGVTFDFEPASALADEVEFNPTRRGADERFDRSTRPRADQRLAAKRARRKHSDEDAEDSEDSEDSE